LTPKLFSRIRRFQELVRIIEDDLLSLFFCRYMSTPQLAGLFFPSASKARSRLAQLLKKGYVTNRTMYIVEPTKWEERVAAQGVWHSPSPASTPLRRP
jgi:hypothetical protein